MTEKNKPATDSHASHAPQGAAHDAHSQAAGATPHAEPIVVTDKRSSQRGSEAGQSASVDAERGSEPAKDGGDEAQSSAYVAALEARLADKEARLEATLGQYKDALDEFNRVKARLTRDVQKEIQAGKKSLLVGLLEIVDNLERALDAAKGDPAQANTPLCDGITMVRDQFHAKLKAAGVRKQLALGHPFDPNHFEAISNVPVTDKAQDGQVVGVVRDAYLLGDETLRHGIVAVGKLESAE